LLSYFGWFDHATAIDNAAFGRLGKRIFSDGVLRWRVEQITWCSLRMQSHHWSSTRAGRWFATGVSL